MTNRPGTAPTPSATQTLITGGTDVATEKERLLNLCSHVDLEQDGEVITVTRGVAVPIYGWSRELGADVPLLRCSLCDATVRLPGPAVRRETRATAPNRAPAEEGWELL